jgi:hypothetical protein
MPTISTQTDTCLDVINALNVEHNDTMDKLMEAETQIYKFKRRAVMEQINKPTSTLDIYNYDAMCDFWQEHLAVEDPKHQSTDPDEYNLTYKMCGVYEMLEDIYDQDSILIKWSEEC